MNQRLVDDQLLREWPLPQPAIDDDKEGRGDALIVGGSSETPGAIVLAAVATLRAGAGRLCVGMAASAARCVSVSVPEARVIALDESWGGALLPEGVDRIGDVLGRCRAALFGPGCMDEAGTLKFARLLLRRASAGSRIVLDAAAMGAATEGVAIAVPTIVTPHAGEMAHLLGISKEKVRAQAAVLAIQAAREWNCVVTLKGATTYVANAQGDLWRHEGGDVGLATAGSGDVLAGLIVGLIARGASLEQAAVWGVALHARAGAALSTRLGPLGFLARELAAEVPSLMLTLRE